MYLTQKLCPNKQNEDRTSQCSHFAPFAQFAAFASFPISELNSTFCWRWEPVWCWRVALGERLSAVRVNVLSIWNVKIEFKLKKNRIQCMSIKTKRLKIQISRQIWSIIFLAIFFPDSGFTDRISIPTFWNPLNALKIIIERIRDA